MHDICTKNDINKNAIKNVLCYHLIASKPLVNMSNESKMIWSCPKAINWSNYNTCTFYPFKIYIWMNPLPRWWCNQILYYIETFHVYEWTCMDCMQRIWTMNGKWPTEYTSINSSRYAMAPVSPAAPQHIIPNVTRNWWSAIIRSPLFLLDMQ